MASAAKNLVFIAGTNKIVPSFDDAMARLKDFQKLINDANVRKVYATPEAPLFEIGLCFALFGCFHLFACWFVAVCFSFLLFICALCLVVGVMHCASPIFPGRVQLILIKNGVWGY